MREKRREVSAHEPEQPIAGVAEAVRDSEEMLRLWREKERRARQALRQLEEAGMTVLPGGR